MLSRTLIAILALHVSTCTAITYTLHHRIGPSQEWRKRGEIQLDSLASNSFTGRPEYRDLTNDQQPWRSVPGYEIGSEDVYQLALTKENESVDQVATPITFVRTCHLASDSDESITIHTGANEQEVLGLNYELTRLEASQLGPNGCPSQSAAAGAAKKVHVQISKTQDALNPAPPPAPIVKPDGTPLKPGEEAPKEQSFLRKYWYIILPVVLLMVIPTEIADANNEEAENGAGGDASFSSSANKARVGAGASNNVRKR